MAARQPVLIAERNTNWLQAPSSKVTKTILCSDTHIAQRTDRSHQVTHMPAKKQFNGSADEVETAFYDALGRADIDGLMALWAEDEEIVCIHPGASRQIGHAAIRASWEAIFERGSVHIQATQLHATHNLLSAVHSVIEQVHNANDNLPDVHILATNVYMKTPQGWRITMHHASVAAGKAPLDLFKASVLH